MKFVAVFLTMFLAAELAAQSSYGTTSAYDRANTDVPAEGNYFTLPPGDLWHRQSWKDSIYRFPDFQDGRLEFANGFSPDTRMLMNYNVFLESIDVKIDGEISALKKIPELKYIWVGDHKFLFLQEYGYLEIILDGKIAVGTRTIMSMAIETGNGFKYLSNRMDVRTATSSMTRHYWPTELYYVLDEKQQTHRIGSRTLQSLLPQMKGKIRSYAKANKIDYRKKEDILRIVKFCNDNYVAAK